ncbi:TPA: phage coat protein, partial [Acinetobacter baumannii]|nr:phage coat protein [Acinetobacter baumannii]HBI9021335.1 phage coat protein [Acinetobacter baumannii]HBI9037180.1 phage coat protein [Acinetobacter baumannii]HBI9061038.1 phage coat protein [Acinetobacter baumannii]HBI9092823.1 phage coat protein [Acinetobacter baumannii]
MPSTQLQDIFVGDYYKTLDPVNSPEKTAVYQSGIVTKNDALDEIANNGQGTSTISYWQDLDANEEANITTDNPDQKGKVGKATQGQMQARTLY